MKVDQNISRLKYLLRQFRMSVGDLLVSINEGRKKELTDDDILGEQIDVNYLKRIDKVFERGINFYLDPEPIHQSHEASIFFRKTDFAQELSFGAVKIVNHFEEVIQSVSTMAKLSEQSLQRKLPHFRVSNDPQEAAASLRSQIYPDTFSADLKTFLKQLIDRFAQKNILVFEFVETWNKKDRANIDGFYLKPNAIILKRQQGSFRREIFTLIHELGHYLLDEEEIEEISIERLYDQKLNHVERWCNDFAFYFLIGDCAAEFEGMPIATSSNDYCHSQIQSLSKATHLSRIALFTRLLLQGKIARSDYDLVKAEFDEMYRMRREEQNKQKELNKRLGIVSQGRTPVPMNSPLLVKTIQRAYYEGIIDERQVCLRLSISPNKLGQYVQ